MSIENLANLSAFLAFKKDEELEKMMDVKSLPFLERTASRVAIQEAEQKDQLRKDMGIVKVKKEGIVTGEGALPLEEFMRKQVRCC
eukprot:20827-Prorocentrum_minimum.AAC.1